MKTSNNKIQAALRWVERTIQENPFCDVTVSFSSHNGNISKLQKSVTQKFVEQKQ